MRRLRSKTIREVSYRKGSLKLQVTDRGFTLWDVKDGRWVLDASTLDDDEEDSDGISIAGGVKQHKTIKGSSRLFVPHYPKKKSKRVSKTRA